MNYQGKNVYKVRNRILKCHNFNEVRNRILKCQKKKIQAIMYIKLDPTTTYFGWIDYKSISTIYIFVNVYLSYE